MGATQTTFCNESNVTISTGLSVLITYYYTPHLLPRECVNYTVGQVWFTAFSCFDSGGYLDTWDTRLGELYFLTNETTAIGLHFDRFPFNPTTYYRTYIPISRKEADYILEEWPEFIPDKLHSVMDAYKGAHWTLYTEMKGFYTNQDHIVRVRGGPRRVIRKLDPVTPNAAVFIVPAKFKPLRLVVD